MDHSLGAQGGGKKPKWQIALQRMQAVQALQGGRGAPSSVPPPGLMVGHSIPSSHGQLPSPSMRPAPPAQFLRAFQKTSGSVERRAFAAQQPQQFSPPPPPPPMIPFSGPRMGAPQGMTTFSSFPPAPLRTYSPQPDRPASPMRVPPPRRPASPVPAVPTILVAPSEMGGEPTAGDLPALMPLPPLLTPQEEPFEAGDPPPPPSFPIIAHIVSAFGNSPQQSAGQQLSLTTQYHQLLSNPSSSPVFDGIQEIPKGAQRDSLDTLAKLPAAPAAPGRDGAPSSAYTAYAALVPSNPNAQRDPAAEFKIKTLLLTYLNSSTGSRAHAKEVLALFLKSLNRDSRTQNGYENMILRAALQDMAHGPIDHSAKWLKLLTDIKTGCPTVFQNVLIEGNNILVFDGVAPGTGRLAGSASRPCLCVSQGTFETRRYTAPPASAPAPSATVTTGQRTSVLDKRTHARVHETGEFIGGKLTSGISYNEQTGRVTVTAARPGFSSIALTVLESGRVTLAEIGPDGNPRVGGKGNMDVSADAITALFLPPPPPPPPPSLTEEDAPPPAPSVVILGQRLHELLDALKRAPDTGMENQKSVALRRIYDFLTTPEIQPSVVTTIRGAIPIPGSSAQLMPVLGLRTIGGSIQRTGARPEEELASRMETGTVLDLADRLTAAKAVSDHLPTGRLDKGPKSFAAEIAKLRAATDPAKIAQIKTEIRDRYISVAAWRVLTDPALASNSREKTRLLGEITHFYEAILPQGPELSSAAGELQQFCVAFQAAAQPSAPESDEAAAPAVSASRAQQSPVTPQILMLSRILSTHCHAFPGSVEAIKAFFKSSESSDIFIAMAAHPESAELQKTFQEFLPLLTKAEFADVISQIQLNSKVFAAFCGLLEAKQDQLQQLSQMHPKTLEAFFKIAKRDLVGSETVYPQLFTILLSNPSAHAYLAHIPFNVLLTKAEYASVFKSDTHLDILHYVVARMPFEEKSYVVDPVVYSSVFLLPHGHGLQNRTPAELRRNIFVGNGWGRAPSGADRALTSQEIKTVLVLLGRYTEGYEVHVDEWTTDLGRNAMQALCSDARLANSVGEQAKAALNGIFLKTDVHSIGMSLNHATAAPVFAAIQHHAGFIGLFSNTNFVAQFANADQTVVRAILQNPAAAEALTHFTDTTTPTVAAILTALMTNRHFTAEVTAAGRLTPVGATIAGHLQLPAVITGLPQNGADLQHIGLRQLLAAPTTAAFFANLSTENLFALITHLNFRAEIGSQAPATADNTVRCNIAANPNLPAVIANLEPQALRTLMSVATAASFFTAMSPEALTALISRRDFLTEIAAADGAVRTAIAQNPNIGVLSQIQSEPLSRLLSSDISTFIGQLQAPALTALLSNPHFAGLICDPATSQATRTAIAQHMVMGDALTNLGTQFLHQLLSQPSAVPFFTAMNQAALTGLVMHPDFANQIVTANPAVRTAIAQHPNIDTALGALDQPRLSQLLHADIHAFTDELRPEGHAAILKHSRYQLVESNMNSATRSSMMDHAGGAIQNLSPAELQAFLQQPDVNFTTMTVNAFTELVTNNDFVNKIPSIRNAVLAAILHNPAAAAVLGGAGRAVIDAIFAHPGAVAALRGADATVLAAILHNANSANALGVAVADRLDAIFGHATGATGALKGAHNTVLAAILHNAQAANAIGTTAQPVIAEILGHANFAAEIVGANAGVRDAIAQHANIGAALTGMDQPALNRLLRQAGAEAFFTAMNQAALIGLLQHANFAAEIVDGGTQGAVRDAIAQHANIGDALTGMNQAALQRILRQAGAEAFFNAMNDEAQLIGLLQHANFAAEIVDGNTQGSVRDAIAQHANIGAALTGMDQAALQRLLRQVGAAPFFTAMNQGALTGLLQHANFAAEIIDGGTQGAVQTAIAQHANIGAALTGMDQAALQRLLRQVGAAPFFTAMNQGALTGLLQHANFAAEIVDANTQALVQTAIAQHANIGVALTGMNQGALQGILRQNGAQAFFTAMNQAALIGLLQHANFAEEIVNAAANVCQAIARHANIALALTNLPQPDLERLLETDITAFVDEMQQAAFTGLRANPAIGPSLAGADDATKARIKVNGAYGGVFQAGPNSPALTLALKDDVPGEIGNGLAFGQPELSSLLAVPGAANADPASSTAFLRHAPEAVMTAIIAHGDFAAAVYTQPVGGAPPPPPPVVIPQAVLAAILANPASAAGIGAADAAKLTALVSHTNFADEIVHADQTVLHELLANAEFANTIAAPACTGAKLAAIVSHPNFEEEIGNAAPEVLQALLAKQEFAAAITPGTTTAPKLTALMTSRHFPAAMSAAAQPHAAVIAAMHTKGVVMVDALKALPEANLAAWLAADAPTFFEHATQPELEAIFQNPGFLNHLDTIHQNVLNAIVQNQHFAAALPAIAAPALVALMSDAKFAVAVAGLNAGQLAFLSTPQVRTALKTVGAGTLTEILRNPAATPVIAADRSNATLGSIVGNAEFGAALRTADRAFVAYILSFSDKIVAGNILNKEGAATGLLENQPAAATAAPLLAAKPVVVATILRDAANAAAIEHADPAILTALFASATPAIAAAFTHAAPEVIAALLQNNAFAAAIVAGTVNANVRAAIARHASIGDALAGMTQPHLHALLAQPTAAAFFQEINTPAGLAGVFQHANFAAEIAAANQGVLDAIVQHPQAVAAWQTPPLAQEREQAPPAAYSALFANGTDTSKLFSHMPAALLTELTTTRAIAFIINAHPSVIAALFANQDTKQVILGWDVNWVKVLFQTDQGEDQDPRYVISERDPWVHELKAALGDGLAGKAQAIHAFLSKLDGIRPNAGSPRVVLGAWGDEAPLPGGVDWAAIGIGVSSDRSNKLLLLPKAPPALAV